jgi:ABC-type spermidine/putrescine transport system permease subunit I
MPSSKTTWLDIYFKLTETITMIIVIMSVLYCISTVLYYLSIDNYQYVLSERIYLHAFLKSNFF